MLLSNLNLSEEGYIAGEVMQTDELTRKCKVIKLTVQDGDFTLDEALDIYQVTKEEFLKFTANSILKDVITTISTIPGKSGAIASVELFEMLYVTMMLNVDSELPKMRKHWKKLSRDIQSDKVSLDHFLDL